MKLADFNFYLKKPFGSFLANLFQNLNLYVDLNYSTDSIVKSNRKSYQGGNVGIGIYNIEGIGQDVVFAHSRIHKGIISSDIESSFLLKNNWYKFAFIPEDNENRFSAKYVDKKNHMIEVYEPGYWLRNVDTEYKIIEYIYKLIMNNIDESKKDTLEGEVHIYTELFCCPSCKEVVENFSNEFPNIEVNIYHSKEK